jgi:hypothetical protein
MDRHMVDGMAGSLSQLFRRNAEGPNNFVIKAVEALH